MPAVRWKDILRQNFTSWEKLADYLQLDEEKRCQILKKNRFPLNLPMRLAQKIEKNHLADPLLKQFLPTLEESIFSPGFTKDPVEDQSFRSEKKLLQKYEGRALLLCTSACAMHCRYCFRKNFSYETEKKGFAEELAWISNDTTIHEVILSGGDPLSLPNSALEQLIGQLSSISHIKRIRFHTRFPIGIPERIDSSFIEILKNCAPQIWFVIHSNHPREWDLDVISSLKQLQRMGVVLLNQAVLLRGVNDNVETLVALCELLADQGIGMYYLYQLDRVQGSAHFEVSEEEGLTLIQEIAKKLPGYAVPRYVQEIPHQHSKVHLGFSY
jgi:EF-P beta-lysylation protein EpmB